MLVSQLRAAARCLLPACCLLPSLCQGAARLLAGLLVHASLLFAMFCPMLVPSGGCQQRLWTGGGGARLNFPPTDVDSSTTRRCLTSLARSDSQSAEREDHARGARGERGQCRDKGLIQNVSFTVMENIVPLYAALHISIFQ